jgi:hypothetical protein
MYSSRLRVLDLRFTELDQIGAGAFATCTVLTDLFVPNTLRRIGRGSFQETALRHVMLSHCRHLQGVGCMAIGKCAQLERLILPSGRMCVEETCIACSAGVAELEVGGTVTDDTSVREYTAGSSCDPGSFLKMNRLVIRCAETMGITFPEIARAAMTVHAGDGGVVGALTRPLTPGE